MVEWTSLDQLDEARLWPAARQAMQAASADAFNPSSQHQLGRRARRLLSRASRQVRHLAAAPQAEVLWVASRAEAVALFLLGGGRAERATSGASLVFFLEPMARSQALEDALVASGLVPVGGDLSALLALDPKHLAGVAARTTENASGTLRELDPLLAWAAKGSIRLLLDASHSAPYAPLPPLSSRSASIVCGAALGGPPGQAALLLASKLDLVPLYGGGGQQRGRRPGTEALLPIVGMGAAAEACVARRKSSCPSAATRRAALVDALGLPGALAPLEPSQSVDAPAFFRVLYPVASLSRARQLLRASLAARVTTRIGRWEDGEALHLVEETQIRETWPVQHAAYWMLSFGHQDTESELRAAGIRLQQNIHALLGR